MAPLFPSNRYFLKDALPYLPSIKRGQRLKDGCKEYLLLLVATEKTFSVLKNKQFDLLDPLVGENSCQIRAVKIAMMLRTQPLEIEEMLASIKGKIATLSREMDNLELLIDGSMSLEDFLLKYDLELSLTFVQFFLVQAYLLTQVKCSRNSVPALTKNEYTDTKKIKTISPVGSMFADRLVTYLRASVAEYSVQFIQTLTARLSLDSICTKFVSEKFIGKHRALQCLPYFWFTKVVMSGALFYKLPIVIRAQMKAKDRQYEVVYETLLAFQSNGDEYEWIALRDLDQTVPVMILCGSAAYAMHALPCVKQWIAEIIEKGPVRLVLAYAAAHRQYPNEAAIDQSVSAKIVAEEFLQYKKHAKEWGCTRDHPATFFLSHAYCDNLKNLLKIPCFTEELSPVMG